ncbi:RNA polymerase sigma factor [Aquibacillus sp. 3ASR75-11]|uniref:RNA polymerase sigma factor n=1 Tax=Terrihalobacillus insolitus TaxID=2950438 RepID=A0A9X3WXJ0_9BACI|nr:RNA polymerase sigma factor [Terrihalobacillus insolitus]MDC3414521.1 RNA polymerase sigma factor [Terrihalobacillus insolitus]MDC3426348.1 RNA polymerase sigma factor [Terrihalobacillus insolitus]
MEENSYEMREYLFNDIYEKFYHRVFCTSMNVIRNRHLAEDVVQETFMKAYKNIDKLNDNSKIGAWLSTIASRTAIDMLRREKRRPCLPLEEITFSMDEDLLPLCTVESEIELLSMKEEMNEKMLQLSPKLQTVFSLKFISQLTDDEIANQLNITTSTVKTRIFRARKIVKDQWIRTEHSETSSLGA